MADNSPFVVLGIAPTLDAAAVKRAYFAQLAKHPPHKDPEGFRQLRAVYEKMLRPGELALAYASSPVDGDAELQLLERWFAEVRANTPVEAPDAASAAEWGQRFFDTLSALTWAEANAAYRKLEMTSRTGPIAS